MSNTKKQRLILRVRDRLKGLRSRGSSNGIPLIVHAFFIVFFIAGGLLYIFEVNATSTKGFEIRAMENKLDKLESIQKELELRQADIRSLSALTAKAKELQLVSVDKLESIASSGSVAVGKK